MARGLWKGAISFGLVNVPVELFSAQKRSAELDRTMLDRRDLAPVGYQRVNKASGKEVPWEDVVKGYEYADDEYVVLSEEDFRRANPEASKTVDITAFVDLAGIARSCFISPTACSPTATLPSAEEGLADVRVIRALYRSIATGEAVELAPYRRRERPSLEQEIRRPPIEKPAVIHAQAPSGGS